MTEPYIFNVDGIQHTLHHFTFDGSGPGVTRLDAAGPYVRKQGETVWLIEAYDKARHERELRECYGTCWKEMRGSHELIPTPIWFCGDFIAEAIIAKLDREKNDAEAQTQ